MIHAGTIPTGATSSIDQRLDSVPALAGRPRTVESLPGGLTNTNLRVCTPDGEYVARLSTPSAGLLAIDREAEHANSLIAATAGIGPAVVDYVPSAGILLLQWLPGTTLTDTDLRADSTLRLVAATCRRLHRGPRFRSDFDMFALQRRYLDTARARGFRLPDRYLDFTAQWAQVRSVLSMSDVRSVACHNDLLAANLILSGNRVWIIDYEYSGNNDPCFELGNIWSEATLPDDALPALLDAYFGSCSAVLLARTRLQALASQYGWTLWGVIQSATSDLDFDFWEWSMQKYDRAVATFRSQEFQTLLAAAAAAPAVSADSAGPPAEGETL